MKKLSKLLLSASCLFALGFTTSCDDAKTIKVCASELPHADVLNNCVAGLLKEDGYKLKVYTLDWQLQNDSVANKDYDANYFQHAPYLATYAGTGEKELVATCKVHYEPLGIYRGKATGDLSSGKTFEVCNDPSNAIRAFELLKAKGVISTVPCDESGENLSFSGNEWTDGNVTVTLIAEDLLVASMADYDFACLPCNTAYTGHINSELRVAKEDDPAQESLKANLIACRKYDYLNNETYKAKIDALTDALLSEEVRTYFADAYSGAMTCNDTTQVDLRSSIN